MVCNFRTKKRPAGLRDAETQSGVFPVAKSVWQNGQMAGVCRRVRQKIPQTGQRCTRKIHTAKTGTGNRNTMENGRMG